MGVEGDVEVGFGGMFVNIEEITPYSSGRRRRRRG